jgi:hypothetical protein
MEFGFLFVLKPGMEADEQMISSPHIFTALGEAAGKGVKRCLGMILCCDGQGTMVK